MDRRIFTLGGGAAVALAGGVGASFLATGSLASYRDLAARQRTPLSAPGGLPDLVRQATLAANGHNTQPWRFRLLQNAIRIEPDFERRTPVVDPDDHHLFTSLGCAAENLLLAANATGHHGELRFDPRDGGALHIDLTPGPTEPSDLVRAIPMRQSTRAEFDGTTLSAAQISELAEAAKEPGVAAAILTDRARLDALSDLVVAGNTAQLEDPAFVRELKSWIRFNPRAAMAAGDGLFSKASGNPSVPRWIGLLAFDLVLTPAADADKYARQIRSSSGAIVFSGDRADPEHWIKVGRACQRFALKATAMGLKHAFLNQPVEVPRLRNDLADLAGLGGRRPDIVLRFGAGPNLPPSLRRPVEAVLIGET